MAEDLILDRYRPIEEAGSGGYGTVVVAWDTRIQRRVAIKQMQIDPDLIPAPIAGDAYDAADIPGLEEARTAALLTDNDIVGVLDFEIRENIAYLIMEYVDGCTLTQLLHDYPDHITLDIVAAVFSSVAHALQVAHENQVLHLDIKPDNVLISRKGEVKVTDFGLSKLSSADGFDRAAGGTIGYMPLEQMRLQPLDARCDEWALAALTYEMIAGHNPLMAPDLKAAARTIEQAELVLPHLCMEGLDEQADDVLFYALAPDRDERYETVADFAEELQPFLGNPKTGKRQLARLVGKATDDAAESIELAPVDFEEGRTPLRLGGLFLRSWAAACCGMLSAVGLSCLAPWLGGMQSPAFWVLLGAVVVLSAAVPHVGALASLVVFAVALVAQGAYVAGAVLLAVGVLWWFFVARFGDECACATLSVVPLGAIGLGAVSSVLCGCFLRTKDAVLSAAMAALLAFNLVGFAASGLGSWDFPSLWASAGLGAANALNMDVLRGFAAMPGPWIDALCWVVAAACLSVMCARGSRVLSFVGALGAGAVLVLAEFARTFMGSAGSAIMPDAMVLARACVPLVVGCALALYGLYPAEEDEYPE